MTANTKQRAAEAVEDEKDAEQITALLTSTHVQELLADRDTIRCAAGETLDHVVKLLSEHKILSVPVVDEEKKEVVGFVDMLDIITYVARVQPTALDLARDDLTSLHRSSVLLKGKPIGEVRDLSGKDPYIVVKNTSSISSLAELFAKGIHRAAVLTDDQGHLPAVCSQSDLVRFLDGHFKGSLQHAGQKTLRQLGYASKPLVCVSPTDTTRKAVETLAKREIGAMAVVDDTGHIVSDFAAKDLRGLFTAENLPHLQDTVEEFLREYSPNALDVHSTTADATLAAVVHTFCELRVHHLWIVEEKKPVGLVTLTDVMEILGKLRHPDHV